jgi:hypothetical protein
MRSNLNSRWTFRILLCLLGFGVCVLASLNVEFLHAQNPKIAAPKTRAKGFDAPKIFDVDNEYGTLSFKGRIERTDLGDKYKYRIQIAVVFLPGETTHDGYTMTNRTKIADLKTCELVATSFVEDGKPYKIIQREWQPIAVRLEKDAEVGTLPDLEFLMPKSAVETATHVGLAVSDGKLLWPIPTELK